MKNLTEAETKQLQTLLNLFNSFKTMRHEHKGVFEDIVEKREEDLNYQLNPAKNEVSIEIKYREEIRPTMALFAPGEKLIKDNGNGTKTVGVPIKKIVCKSMGGRFNKFELHLRDQIAELIKKEMPDD